LFTPIVVLCLRKFGRKM